LLLSSGAPCLPQEQRQLHQWGAVRLVQQQALFRREATLFRFGVETYIVPSVSSTYPHSSGKFAATSTNCRLT